MVAIAPPVLKVAIRCGQCDKKLAVVPVNLLDKGIEIVCPRCGWRNLFE